MSAPTSWSPEWPLDADDHVLQYSIFIQLWYACREVEWILGGELFPAGLHVWEKGIITNAVDNGDGTSTITDSSKTWGIPADGFDNPWAKVSGTELAKFIPTGWRVGLGNSDVTQATAGDMQTWTSDSATFNGRLMDLVTAGLVPDLAFFVGQPLYIFGVGKPFWNEQWPEWPNAETLASGTIYGATTTTLVVSGVAYSTTKFTDIDTEIMCRDTTGALLRLAVTSVTVDTSVAPVKSAFHFAAATHAPQGSSPFAVINAGDIYLPGQAAYQPWCYYQGLMKGYYSHQYDDTLVLGPTPRTASEPISEGGDSTDCPDEAAITILDKNYWTIFDNECGPANEPLNPNVTKSPRWLLRWILDVCTSFLPSASAQGNSKDPSTAFAGYGPATLLAAAGEESWSGVCGSNSVSVGGTNFRAVPLPVYWDIKATNGGVVSIGTGTIDSSGVLSGLPTGFTGNNIIVSPGPRNWTEKQFGCIYPRRRWTPDADPDSIDGTGYIVPPREPLVGETAGPGTWVDTDPATGYSLIGENNGVRSDSTRTADLFKTNDIARYMPGTFFDLTTTAEPDINSNVPPAAFYQDRIYAGNMTAAHNAKHEAAKSGIVDAANVTTRHLLDPSKDFFNISFWDGSNPLIEFTGTEHISGTSASLASKSASAFFDNARQWFVAQTIEGQTGVDGDGNPIWYPQLITTQTGGTTLSWAESMPSTTNWRIQVPDSSPNWWKGRTLTLTPIMSDGSTGAAITVKLDGNGRHALFFPTITLASGAVKCAWKISELSPYGVYKKTSTDWVPPTGDDAPLRQGRTGTNAFHLSLTENFADVLKDYGLMRPETFPVEVGNQIYRLSNLLFITRDSGTWTAKGENNVYQAGTGTSASGGDQSIYTLAVIEGYVNSAWGTSGSFSDPPATNGSATLTSVDQSPRAVEDVAYQYDSDAGGTPTPDSLNSFGLGATANYAYYEVTEPTAFPGRPTNTGEVWVFTGINSSDDPPLTIACNGSDLHYTGVGGIAIHTWTDEGAVTSDGMGNQFSGKVGNTTAPPWDATVAPIFAIDFSCGLDPCVDSNGCLLYTGTYTGYGAQSHGSYAVISDVLVRTWARGFHA